MLNFGSWSSRLLLVIFTFIANPADAKVGILIGSFGDIDHPELELRSFIRNTLTDPDILPLHPWLRRTIADIGWYIEKRSLFSKYAAIGGSSQMRKESRRQAIAIESELRTLGIDGKVYTGFTMTWPYVADALAAAKADGVKELIVLHQGAQYAPDTVGILLRHVRNYLATAWDWDVNARAISSFSDDPRFLSLITEQIRSGLNNDFPGLAKESICMMLPIHGTLDREQSQTYLQQVRHITESIRNIFPENKVYVGFQNHDEIPLISWSKPTVAQALQNIDCSGVLINGNISFTVDNLETLFEQHIETTEVIRQNAERRGKPHPRIVVQKVWNGDTDFARFIAQLISEALSNRTATTELH